MKILKLLVVILFWGNWADAELKVPQLNLAFWQINEPDYMALHNNCYNYASNRVTNDFAQPGQSAGVRLIYYDCEEIRSAILSDRGIVPTDFFEFSEKNNQDSLLALVVDRGQDFHWYRRDDNNLWSHKPGRLSAINKDNSGKLIESPETADRGPYVHFCGYYRVKNFPTEAHEQNAGYVRIGNMKTLPADSVVKKDEPYLEKLIYSGKENPKFFLNRQNSIKQKEAFVALTESLFLKRSKSKAGLYEARLGFNGYYFRDEKAQVISGVREAWFYLSGEVMVVNDQNEKYFISNENKAELFALMQKIF